MNLPTIITFVILPILTLAVALAFIRLVRGPSREDGALQLAAGELYYGHSHCCCTCNCYRTGNFFGCR